jgi:hypothetical protein
VGVSPGNRLRRRSRLSRDRSVSFLPLRADPMRVSSDLRVATLGDALGAMV